MLLNSKRAGGEQHSSLLHPSSSTTALSQFFIRIFCDNFGLSAIPAAFDAQSSFSRRNSTPDEVSNQASRTLHDDLALLWPVFQDLSATCRSNAPNVGGHPNHPAWEAAGNNTESSIAASSNNRGSWYPTTDQMEQAETVGRTSAIQAVSQLDDTMLDESLLMQNFPEFEASLGSSLPLLGSATSIDRLLQLSVGSGEVVDTQDLGNFLDNSGAFDGSDR
jgi:hypothetical protein